MMEKEYKEFLDISYELNNIENVHTALKSIIGVVGEIVVLWIGGLEVMSGNFSIGDLVAYNVLIGYFLGPVSNVINLQSQVQSALVSIRRIHEIEIMEKEPDANNSDFNINSITFKDVSFSYNDVDYVLNHVDMVLREGQKVAIIGESGCGKSTLVKLLIKLYSCNNGNILINSLISIK